MKGTENYTKIVKSEKDGMYQIVDSKTGTNCYGSALFQRGPILEVGVNGCHNEDLIAIVIDQLEGFQKTEYACAENQKAINKLMEAMFWLNVRTSGRKKRGVEGTSKV